MNYAEIRQLALEVGDVMTQQYDEFMENILDVDHKQAHKQIHKNNDWLIHRLDGFSSEELIELIDQTLQMSHENTKDIETYSNLLSLRSICITVLTLRGSDGVSNAR